jgi:hypothetical protein
MIDREGLRAITEYSMQAAAASMIVVGVLMDSRSMIMIGSGMAIVNSITLISNFVGDKWGR